MQKPYDVAVAWRIYPAISKTPLIFPTDKFKLVSTCLQSFIDSVKDLKIRYFFILDACPDIYHQLIQGLFDSASTTIIQTPGIGNWATFKKQIEILTTQEDADLVYFGEDDYLYRPGEFHKLVDFMRKGKKVDFVTPYLHMDTFTHPIHHQKKIKQEAAQHVWCTDSSTCLTFLTSKEKLISTKNTFLTYSKGNNDCAVWLVLTKTFIWNPVAYLKFFFTHKESFSILKMAVKYSFRYFFSFKKYRLWVPYPAIGTHLEKGCESPDIDWQSISDNINSTQKFTVSDGKHK